VAAVFSFTVLTTGLFTSKETEKASQAAITAGEKTLVRMGSIIAGGTCYDTPADGCRSSPGGPVDWDAASCGARNGRPIDDGGDCTAHAQLVRFKLTPSGDDPIGFNPQEVSVWWHDTGTLFEPGDPPVSTRLPLFATELSQTEEQAQDECLLGLTQWCYRFEPNEQDLILESGEAVEIFVNSNDGSATGPSNIHPLRKNTLITIEVHGSDGSLVMLNAKMPPVITQVMDITR